MVWRAGVAGPFSCGDTRAGTRVCQGGQNARTQHFRALRAPARPGSQPAIGLTAPRTIQYGNTSISRGFSAFRVVPPELLAFSNPNRTRRAATATGIDEAYAHTRISSQARSLRSATREGQLRDRVRGQHQG